MRMFKYFPFYLTYWNYLGNVCQTEKRLLFGAPFQIADHYSTAFHSVIFVSQGRRENKILVLL